MESIVVTLDYRGTKLSLSPETSMRYRKLAAALGTTPERAAIDALSKAQSENKLYFLTIK